MIIPSSSVSRYALAATGRPCAAVLCLCLALSGVAPAQEQAGQNQAPAAGKRLKQTEEGLLRNIWWNQEDVIEKLGLAQSQRAAMDTIFKRFRLQRLEAQERNPVLREAFTEALRQGKWQQARSLNQETAELAGARVAAQPALKIEILSLLTTEQFATFDTEYEHLYQRPWFRRMNIGGDRTRGRTRGGQDRPAQGSRQPAGD